MKEIKMKKINNKDIIIFIITFVITCIIFGPLLIGHYASDTYNISNIGYHDYAIKYSLNDGRIFMAILGLIADKINISIELYVFMTLFFALLISNISVVILRKIIKKYKKSEGNIEELIITAISYITIFNFMYLENMYFVESIVMAISILIFIISANIIVEKNKNYIINSSILTILGVMCYQGTIGMFFTFVFLFTILKNKNDIKQILIDCIKSGIIAVIAIGIDLLIVKIVGNIIGMKQTRYGKISNIPENIKFIILTLPNIIQECCYLFPKNVLFAFISILTIIIIIYEIKNLKEENNILYKYLAILFITIASCNIIQLTTLTSFNTGRLRNSLGALVGVIFIFIYVETPILKEKGKLKILAFFTLISFTIINIINYESIILEHKEVNRLEKQEVKKINTYITEYEQNTGIKVTKIVKIEENDRNKAYFEGMKNKSGYTYNSIKVYWASDGIINFYTGRNLENVKITKEQYEEYIKNQDEQRGYECIGDTLYVNTYIR